MARLIEENGRHYYETPAGVLPSSTTILGILAKPALVNWAVKTTIGFLAEKLDDIKSGKITLSEENASSILYEAKRRHRDIKEESADIGSLVHEIIEFSLNGNDTSKLINEKTEKPFNGFLEWKSKRKFSLVGSEMVVWSRLGYAGTLDCAAYLDGKLYIIDFKTSNAIYSEYVMQVASYIKAYEENTGDIVEGSGILRLDKVTGMPEWVEFTKEEIELAFKKFKCLLEYYKLSDNR
jgi:hypothetical protein